MSSNGTKIFVSYAKEDGVVARKLYEDLTRNGCQTWIDFNDLLPGQKWAQVIAEEIKKCRLFVALLSSHSITKKGHVQNEIRQAIEVAQDYPDDDVFIVPIRIDECEPTFAAIRQLHRIDLFPDYDKALSAVLGTIDYVSQRRPSSSARQEAKPSYQITENSKYGSLTPDPSAKRVGQIARVTDKFFGFIRPMNSHNRSAHVDLFFHAVELVDLEYSSLREGDMVYFCAVQSPHGPIAVNVSRV